jgi:DNA-binding SARP family transcriptional activator
VSTGNKQLVTALRDVAGSDVADARRRLIQRQATRIFIRTLGSIDVHRGSWTGPEVSIDKRRLRGLLGLLTAFSGRVLSRDEAIEILWPEAEPASAVNSLNQAVFQLRRLLDPAYRDGDSPLYILSSAESVELSPDLVRTDLAEVRRLIRRSAGAANAAQERELVAETVQLIRGEFVPELKYEDWAAPVRATIHSELRAVLLPVAERDRYVADPEVAVQAALALIRLDEFDERAQAALALALAEGGRGVAGKESITRFAAKVRREYDEEPSDLIMHTIRKLSDVSNET